MPPVAAHHVFSHVQNHSTKLTATDPIPPLSLRVAGKQQAAFLSHVQNTSTLSTQLVSPTTPHKQALADTGRFKANALSFLY